MRRNKKRERWYWKWLEQISVCLSVVRIRFETNNFVDRMMMKMMVILAHWRLWPLTRLSICFYDAFFTWFANLSKWNFWNSWILNKRRGPVNLTIHYFCRVLNAMRIQFPRGESWLVSRFTQPPIPALWNRWLGDLQFYHTV